MAPTGSSHPEFNKAKSDEYAISETVMRLLAFFVLVWSLSALGVLFWLTHSQPRIFKPLIMRESDSEAVRAEAIDIWKARYIPTNTHSLMGQRSPLERYNWDVRLSEVATSADGTLAIAPHAKPASFEKRLYELNIGVESFHRDYWARVWVTVEMLVIIGVASLLCLTFARILPSCILLGAAIFAQLDAVKWSGQEPSWLWFMPIVGAAFPITSIAIYRWWVVPAPVEVRRNWNQLWLGVLLTGIGVGAIIALSLWGGRVRSSGLAGIGLSFGWGIYLITLHSWQLLRTAVGLGKQQSGNPTTELNK